ncbi:MAG: hypothetical protein JSU72_03585 [Deltaproteobacteria bacterium]|nr:MAG: hypothetical protein JSU72_03585 [Deltaproteobacteria bacterium]
MKVEMRLKALLQEYGLYERGVEKNMADSCGLHRHTIGKLLRNEVKNPSLEVLGRVCGWLEEHNVPAEKLPGALLKVRPADLWQAFGGSNRVAIYLGMYAHIGQKHNERKRVVPMSVARHDAALASKINQLLCSEAEMGGARPGVTTQYVPFQFSLEMSDVGGRWFEEDKKRAKGIFKRIRKREHHESAIMLGSQRVNYVVECLVADLFGCEPFEPVEDGPKVPFYVCYREHDRPVPSCFGGRDNPPGVMGAIRPGTYYLDENKEWNVINWRQNAQDAGVVVIIRNAETVLMALFGCSGRATCAVGNELLYHAEEFWPNVTGGKKKVKKGEKIRALKRSTSGSTLKKSSREIGVYICQVNFREPKDELLTWAIDDCEKDEVIVKPLAEKVLETHLN